MVDPETLNTLVAHARKNRLLESDLDELVHELKAREAADVNNSGLEKQIGYIIEILGPTQAMARIDDILS